MEAHLLVYTRKIYSLTDVATDVGGIANFLLLLFSMTMGPLAKHSFITKAISKFYFAKTKDNRLF